MCRQTLEGLWCLVYRLFVDRKTLEGLWCLVYRLFVDGNKAEPLYSSTHSLFLSILGNVGVLVYRLFVKRGRSLQAYRVLVINLSVADCLMGLYLAIIGSADAQYRGHYVTQDTEWRHSVTCKVAGFLALLSCEVIKIVFKPLLICWRRYWS